MNCNVWECSNCKRGAHPHDCHPERSEGSAVAARKSTADPSHRFAFQANGVRDYTGLVVRNDSMRWFVVTVRSWFRDDGGPVGFAYSAIRLCRGSGDGAACGIGRKGSSNLFG